MRVHAGTSHEGEHYVSRCVGANVAAQGATPDETERNLAEAVALSGVTVEEPAEPPRLALVAVEAPVVAAPPAEEDVDGPALVRGRAVVVPLATRIAPGVYRVVRARIAEAEAEETAARRAVFARMDALFAVNPWEGDVTALIREERDSH